MAHEDFGDSISMSVDTSTSQTIGFNMCEIHLFLFQPIISLFLSLSIYLSLYSIYFLPIFVPFRCSFLLPYKSSNITVCYNLIHWSHSEIEWHWRWHPDDLALACYFTLTDTYTAPGLCLHIINSLGSITKGFLNVKPVHALWDKGVCVLWWGKGVCVMWWDRLRTWLDQNVCAMCWDLRRLRHRFSSNAWVICWEIKHLHHMKT